MSVVLEFKKGKISQGIERELIDDLLSTREKNPNMAVYFPTYETPDSYLTLRKISSFGFSFYHNNFSQNLNYTIYLGEKTPDGCIKKSDLKKISIGSKFLMKGRYFYLEKIPGKHLKDRYIFVPERLHSVLKVIKKILFVKSPQLTELDLLISGKVIYESE